MKTKISALIDGELDAHEMREVCVSMRKDGALRQTCSTYVLIGDALRSESCLASEITGAVLDRLADEPVVLAPGAIKTPPRPGRHGLRPALALAATLAGVAVVAWVGLSTYPNPAPSAQQLQLADKTIVSPVPVATARDAGMQEYLIAHQIQGGSVFLNGDTQHIRTVSMSRVEPR